MKLLNFRHTFARTKTISMNRYPASVIAYAFIKKGIDSNLFVTQLKLQKMVYFANGYHLAKHNNPLIVEAVQAWKYGPVIPELYQVLKAYGNSPITDPIFLDFIGIDKEYSKIDQTTRETIDYTWEATKSVSAENLVRWTHKVDSPWDKAWKKSERNTTINNTEILDYFTNLIFQTNGK